MAYAIGFILLLLRGQGSMFNGGYFPASSMAEDASGNFFTIHETGGHDDYVFGTQNGFFAVDTEGGTILSGPKAASKDFDSTTAGTYRALFYTKSNAQMGQNNVESGTASEENGTVTIGANGSVVITDSQGNTIASGTVAAIADTTYIANDGHIRARRLRHLPRQHCDLLELQDRSASGAERNLRIFLRGWVEVKTWTSDFRPVERGDPRSDG